MEMKVDPRIIKTRTKLKSAFLELLSEKSINEINVKDLTTEASVTRGTFYLHFKDKNMFTEEMMQHFIDDLFNASMKKNAQGAECFSLSCFLAHVEEYPELVFTLLNDAEAVDYRVVFEEKLYDKIMNFLVTNGTQELKVPKKVLMNYLMFTFLGYVEGWLNEGKIYATHYMATTLAKILDSELIQEAELSDFFVK